MIDECDACPMDQCPVCGAPSVPNRAHCSDACFKVTLGHPDEPCSTSATFDDDAECEECGMGGGCIRHPDPRPSEATAADRVVARAEGVVECRYCGATFLTGQWAEGHDDESCLMNIHELIDSGELVRAERSPDYDQDEVTALRAVAVAARGLQAAYGENGYVGLGNAWPHLSRALSALEAKQKRTAPDYPIPVTNDFDLGLAIGLGVDYSDAAEIRDLIKSITSDRNAIKAALARVRGERGLAIEALEGLLSNIKMHHDEECPGITPRDCLDAIYEAAEVARHALGSPKRSAEPTAPAPTCEHREWLEGDEVMASGPKCGAPAKWYACTEYINQPVCDAHKCRCRKPILGTDSDQDTEKKR